MIAHFILYVRDQRESTDFYEAVLELTPRLNVPGMTEFELSQNCVLGLMPEHGIKKLLGHKLPDPSTAHGIPRAELYLIVKDAREHYLRAIAHGAIAIGEAKPRDWGDTVAYCTDIDGHVLAFAQMASSS